MRPTFLVLAPLLLAAAHPAAAQDVIRPGDSVTGELALSDRVLDDGTHYDVWRFPAQANHTYRVIMRSDDFDAVVVVGTETGLGCVDCMTDDDGGDGTNASVAYTGTEDGTYEIRAKSYDEEALGAYELILVDEGVHQEHEAAAIASTPIALGQTVQGALARGDGKDHGRSYSDTYSYHGRAGETLVITLTSAAFDARLNFGRVNRGTCMELDSDDDGGEGTNSRLVVTLQDDGEHHVHVGSSEPGGRGAYTLTVERGAEVAEREPDDAARWPIQAGRTIEGRLDPADPRAGDDSFYEAWTYMGGVGERITIRMSSTAFDTYLVVGRMVGGEWTELQTNDDGPDGSNSELTMTLPQNGEYVIRANSFSPGHVGPYTLRIDRH